MVAAILDFKVKMMSNYYENYYESTEIGFLAPENHKIEVLYMLISKIHKKLDFHNSVGGHFGFSHLDGVPQV